MNIGWPRCLKEKSSLTHCWNCDIVYIWPTAAAQLPRLQVRYTNNHTLGEQIKVKLPPKTIAWPFVLYGYGSESRTLRASDLDNWKAFAMTCYRRMLQNSWKDHRTPRNLCWTRSVQRTFVARAKTAILRPYDHSRTSVHIFDSRLDGTRSRGRKRWGDDIADGSGKTLVQFTTVAIWQEQLERTATSLWTLKH